MFTCTNKHDSANGFNVVSSATFNGDFLSHWNERRTDELKADRVMEEIWEITFLMRSSGHFFDDDPSIHFGNALAYDADLMSESIGFFFFAVDLINFHIFNVIWIFPRE